MGLFKKLASAFGWLKHEVRILVIGLDNSGKTTLVNIIKPKKSLLKFRLADGSCESDAPDE